MNIICALCGFDTLGDFYIAIPGQPDAFMHTITCGPVLVGQQQAAEPTHRKTDGAYQRVGQ